MKGGRAEAERAFRGAGLVRLVLLHGADEAGSRANALALGRLVGGGVERIDLSPATLKADPARLADEAAAGSLFGGARWIRVEGAGDECLAAVDALLEAPAAGNPVAMVAGQLRQTSKLLKRALDSAAVVSWASYPPTPAELERLAGEMALAAGLRPEADVARRLAMLAGGDRAVLAAEIEKYAAFLDASPAAPKPLGPEALDALSADAGEADLNRLVAAVAGGDPAAAEAEMTRLAAIGTSPIPIVRAVQRRLLLLAELTGEVERGNSPATVVRRPGLGLWAKEQEAVARQLGRWRAADAAAALTRVAEAGRAAMGPLGELAVERALGEVARKAARGR